MKTTTYSLVLSQVLFLTSCGDVTFAPDTTKEEETVPVEQQKSSLYLGKDNTGPYGKVIPVCWEPSTNTTYQYAVQDAVTKAYESDSGIHFTGWKRCNGDKYSQGIRIRVADERSKSYIGTANAGVVNNMTLNFTYKNWDANCPRYYGLENCVRWTAVHEFGHALSAQHEHLRLDTPADCTQFLKDAGYEASEYSPTDQYYKKGLYPSDWDWRSTMNYCNSGGTIVNGINYTAMYGLSFQNSGILSAIDLTNWQALYGRSKTLEKWISIFENSAQGVEYFAINPRRSYAPFYIPDLYRIQSSGSTPTGKMRLSAASSASGYTSLTTDTSTAVPLNNGRSDEFGYTVAQIDLDDTPELIYFTRDYSVNKLGMHILSGASDWQSYSLRIQLPTDASSDYKFTFGDHDGDGYQDLYIMRPYDDYNMEIVIRQGPTFSNVLARSISPWAKGAHSQCRYLAGNLYNHPSTQKAIDLLCFYSNQTSASSDVSIWAWQANTNISNPYAYPVEVAIPTQIRNVDGRFANFGLHKISNIQTTAFPGASHNLIFINPQGGSSRTEASFMEAAKYF